MSREIVSERQKYILRCLSCNYEVQDNNLLQSYCPRCSGVLTIEYSKPLFKVIDSEKGVWRYLPLLPSIYSRVSFGEGLTPLNKVGKVFIKNERFNPTGSYADRASAIIASYIKDVDVKSVIIPYVKDFTRSLTYYLLSIDVNIGVRIDSIFNIELNDLMFFSLKDIELIRMVDDRGLYVDYINPLTIEGLKTIVFEVHEKKINVDHIVVPAETGLLAISIQKGLKDLQESGNEISCEVVAAKVKGPDPPLLRGIRGIRSVEVPEAEVYEAYKKFISKGFRTKPLAILSYYVAESLGNSLAVVTMGFTPQSRSRSMVKKFVLDILSKKSPLTAYKIWKEKPVYTLRAVYKAIKDMEARGEICFDVVAKRGRKVKLYKLC